MHPTPVRTILVSALLVLAGALGHAQAPPAAPAAGDAAMAGQKAAFLALPEATRKAAQDALVWLGFYNGVADGDFGKRTRDAILAFQASTRAPADGALSADELKALLAAAANARDAVGFRILMDPKTGAKIGAPTKLFAARERGQARIRIERRPRLGRPLRAPVGRDADPQGRVQGDEARRILRRVGAGGAAEVLYAFREERGGEPADPRLHLRLSRHAGRRARPHRDRNRQFV